MKYLEEKKIDEILQDFKKNQINDTIIAKVLGCSRSTITTARNTGYYTKYVKLSMTVVFSNATVKDIIKGIEYNKIIQLSKAYCEKYDDGIDDILYDLRSRL